MEKEKGTFWRSEKPAKAPVEIRTPSAAAVLTVIRGCFSIGADKDPDAAEK